LLTIYCFHNILESIIKEDIRYHPMLHISIDFFHMFCKLISRRKKINIDNIFDEKYNEVIFTFDDGFESNMKACEILEQYQIPSIFYITSSFIQNNDIYFSDYIRHMIQQSKNNILKLPWKIYDSLYNKFYVCNEIITTIKNNKIYYDQKYDIIDSVFEQTNTMKLDKNDKLYKKLSIEQLKKIVTNKLFRIGNHTHTHCVLPFHTRIEQIMEIQQCNDFLEKEIHFVDKYFAYPSGMYSNETIDICKELNYINAVTTLNGMNTKHTQPYMLKRICVYESKEFLYSCLK